MKASFLSSKKFLAFAIILLGVYLNWRWRKPGIPPNLLGNRVDFYPEFIDKEVQQELLEIMKGLKVFPASFQGSQFNTTTYEHIGEAEPFDPEKGCKNPYLIPNAARTLCTLPTRFDFLRNWMIYGGIDGLKENLDMLATRIQSFGQYIFNIQDYPVMMEKLFFSEKFIEAARKICPSEKQVLDPYSFHFVIQIPGQALPIHIDSQYMEHASRFQYPAWLPTIMAASGLYQDKLIEQVQGVLYLHEWNDTDIGGHFATYNRDDNTPDYEIPYPRGVGLVDGSRTMHASTVFKPNAYLPILPKDAKNELVYQEEGDIWELQSDEKVLNRYKTNEFRIILVYRSRCFASEEKRQSFREWHKSGKNVRPIEVVLNELKSALVSRFGYTKEELDAMPRLQLANVLANTFLNYPRPVNAIIPFNYCALPVIMPWTDIFFKLIC